MEKALTAKRASRYKPYTEAEKVSLRAKYSKDQLAAIEAGEQAISSFDLADQAALRRDAFVPPYLDDFSRIEPVIDKKIEKIRGEEQDYEKAVAPFHVPDVPEDFITLHELKRDDEHIGHWETRLDDKGNDVLEYVGREHELDYFAEKYFRETPECAEYMRRQMLNLDDPAVNFQSIESLEVEYAEDQEEVIEDETEDLAEEDEEVREINAANGTDSAGAQAAEQADLNEPIEPAVEFSIDFKSQPKYQEIRTKLVAAGPMRRKYGFGSTEPQRAMDRLMQGVQPDVAPDIPKIEDPTVVWGPTAGEEGAAENEQDDTGGLEDEALMAYQRVSKELNQSIRQLLRYRTKIITSHYVTNQTRLGKIQSLYVLCVAGNSAGMLGIGEGKAIEGDEATRMAKLNAIKNLKPVPRYENRTIYGDVSAKCSATVVELSARRPGFGVRTNSHIFEIARCAGIQDLAARVPRSRNPMNVAKATVQALRSQKDPEDIARGRGKKLVDVRKVYYSGLV